MNKVLTKTQEKMKYIKRLPKQAEYDYTDAYGGKHYHTKKRYYTIYRGSILSETEKEHIKLR